MLRSVHQGAWRGTWTPFVDAHSRGLWALGTLVDVPPPEESFRETLELFTYRARRVESHSLLQDRAQLVRWAQGTFRAERSADVGDTPGGWWVSQELPDEEPVESLASRCRPFVVESDTVH